MKKSLILLLLATIIFSFPVYAESTEPETEQNISELLDYDSLVDEVVDKLVYIGVTELDNTIIESLEETAGIINVTLVCETIGEDFEKTLEINMHYATILSDPEWYVDSIKKYNEDSEEPNMYYYVPDSLIEKVDIYDYETDELISAATEELNSDETMDEYQKTLDDTQKEFKEYIQGLRTEYGID